MTLRLTKTAFQIGSQHGIALELHSDGVRIGSAELMLPADDSALDHVIDRLISQASRHGVRISGAKRLALFHEIEMGAVL